MKVMTIVGTRPEFIQIAPVSRALRLLGHQEQLVHTGQHYDANMSDVFFADLNLPRPDFFLEVGSGSHAEQTGKIMTHFEALLQVEVPDWVVVFGDTNSTLATSLAAAKLNIPVAHVEAGLRSFDRTMPEEINRCVVDHVSNLLLAPTANAMQILAREGLAAGACQVGDVRVDLLADLQEYTQGSLDSVEQEIREQYGTAFALTTIHRASNTDYKDRLGAIVDSLNTLGMPVVIPVHPRLEKMMKNFGLVFSSTVHAIEPVGFIKMVALLRACRLVITDSGGLQKESYILERPTITVRDSTEWVETVEAGWNRLCEPDTVSLSAALDAALQSPPATHPDYYGTYGVGKRIVALLEDPGACHALTAEESS